MAAILLLVDTNNILLTDIFSRAGKIWEDLSKENFGTPVKRCKSQLTRGPSSRNKPLEARINLTQRMAH